MICKRITSFDILLVMKGDNFFFAPMKILGDNHVYFVITIYSKHIRRLF